MKKLNDLPRIVFVNADANEVESIILGEYKAVTGRTLAKGDPVRLFLLTIANIIVLLLNCINETGKQNLLRYATGSKLDHLGALVGVERVQATQSITSIKITLSEPLGLAVAVPMGTRFTAGDNVFFALKEMVTIPAGQMTGIGLAQCETAGEIGNGYLPGQINTMVDPLPYVDKVENITKSEGGSEIESDDDFREDIHVAPESFSVAGPTGAYKYHAKRAANNIIDVAVWSPVPGEVEVRPLMEGGEIPGAEMLAIVSNKLNDRDVRPLTDKVTVLAPEVVKYNVKLSYYIDRENETRAAAIQQAVNEAVNDFVAWQKGKLGRDVNPSELHYKIIEAGAKRADVIEPVFTRLNETEVGIAQSIQINFGGLENG